MAKFVKIVNTYKGYEIQVNDDGKKFPAYVRKVYGGKIEYVTDYLYSKKYKTVQAARKIANMIASENGATVIDYAD